MLSVSKRAEFRKGILGSLTLTVLLLFFITVSPLPALAQAAPSSLATVLGSNFVSTFNTNHNGWTPVYGPWALSGSAFYKSTGVPNGLSSIKHAGTYGDFVYEVKMRRNGTCDGCANALMVRGDPASLDFYHQWMPEYWFAYNNHGKFNVWYASASHVWAPLKNWTLSNAIVKGGWNRLRVRAAGSSLKLFINGTLVWSGNNAALPSGQVGIGLFRTTGSGTLLVDSASLTKVTAADVDSNAALEPGIEVPGGTMFWSPYNG